MNAPADHFSDPQRERLQRFAAAQSVDVHCHCLPCVDDGPGTLVDALALCRGLVDDGITTVVATPHQLGRYHGQNEAAAVRRAVEALNRALMVDEVPLKVLPGADVRLDERIGRLLAEDRVLTVGDGGTYLLLELPHETYIDPLVLLRSLAQQGVRSIITHPERHRYVAANPRVVDPWLSEGASLQLTAGSLSGDFGQAAQRAAWFWLETGAAAVVATDAHDMRNRPPRMSEAIRLIARRLGEGAAGRACVENPARVLAGDELLALRPTPEVEL